jgi:hypothetical protein
MVVPAPGPLYNTDLHTANLVVPRCAAFCPARIFSLVRQSLYVDLDETCNFDQAYNPFISRRPSPGDCRVFVPSPPCTARNQQRRPRMTSCGADPTVVGGSDATEASPLLGAVESTESRLRKQHRFRVIFIVFAMFFFLEFGAGLLLPGTTAALEQRICGEVYANLNPIDRDCKAPAVQGSLAVLKGWQTTLDCIPGRSRLLALTTLVHS